MSWRIKNELSDKYDLHFVFANTGEENEQTLEFVQRCDEAWDLGVVWVEAVVDPVPGNGTRHRIVTFETASRDSEPFEAVIRKYGIPNLDFQPCNRELKLNAMNSYMRSIGHATKTYETAVGIRVDEARRVNAKQAAENRIIYPFIDLWPTDKQDVHTFFEDQPFRLQLREHEGNCKSCWKKSDRKLFQLIAERPEIFDFNRRMEAQYGFHGAPHYGDAPAGTAPRVFFRFRRSTEQLFAQAREAGVIPAQPLRWIPIATANQMPLDLDSGCSESCEPYEMEAA